MPRRKTTTEEVNSETNSTINPAEMSTETLEANATEESAVKLVKEKGVRLEGQELLALIKENKDEPVDDVIYKAGYFTRTVNPETGESKITIHKNPFFQAMSMASNPELKLAPAKRAYAPRQGRKPIVTVVKNGNIVVGSRHGLVAGFAPQSKVKIEAEAGRIVLTAYQSEDGPEEVDSDIETEGDDTDLDL